MHKGEAYCQSHVAAIKQEGLSASAYAKLHGLAVNRLYYGQRKVADVAAVGTAKQAALSFIALRVESAGGRPATNGPLIRPSGLRLEMSSLPAPAWLAALSHASRGAH